MTEIVGREIVKNFARIWSSKWLGYLDDVILETDVVGVEHNRFDRLTLPNLDKS